MKNSRSLLFRCILAAVILAAMRPETSAAAEGGRNGLRDDPQLIDQPARELPGHLKAVRGIAYSPDGTLLASAGEDRTIRIWDAAAAKEIRKIAGHTNFITSLAFSPDGRRIASGSEDATVRVWEVKTGEQIAHFADHSQRVHCVAYHPDNRRVVSGSCDRYLRVWDVEKDEPLTKYQEPSCVKTVAISPDGTFFAYGMESGYVQVREAESGKLIATVDASIDRPEHRTAVRSVAWLDGQQLLTSASPGALVWDVREKKTIGKLQGDEAGDVVVSPDRKQVVLVSHRGARIFDLKSRQFTKLISPVGRRVLLDASWSPDGRWLATSGSDGLIPPRDPLKDCSLLIWDLSEQRKEVGHPTLVSADPTGWTDITPADAKMTGWQAWAWPPGLQEGNVAKPIANEWKVVDSAKRIIRSPAGRTRSQLLTDKQYSDFILHLQWREVKDGYRLGAVVRMQPQRRVLHEIHLDDFFLGSITGLSIESGRKVYVPAFAVHRNKWKFFGMDPPEGWRALVKQEGLPSPPIPIEELGVAKEATLERWPNWNTAEIVVQRDVIKAYVNGTLTGLCKGVAIAQGQLGLISDQSEFEVRGIKIKQLGK